MRKTKKILNWYLANLLLNKSENTVNILIMHCLRLEPTWNIGIYACILILNNAYQPMHNLAGYAPLDVLVPISKWKVVLEEGLNLVLLRTIHLSALEVQ